MLKLFTTYRILLVIWIVVLLVLGFYTPQWFDIQFPFSNSDKFKHLFGAFVLAILFYKSFKISLFKKVILIWAMASIVFELLQPYLTNGKRQFGFLDIAFNIIGFGLGYFIFNYKNISAKKHIKDVK